MLHLKGCNLYALICSIIFLIPINISSQSYSITKVASQNSLVEICDNGIDDDENGLIDCFDDACACQEECLAHYYDNCEIDCQFQPACDSFQVKTLWTSQAIVGSFPNVVGGDLDGDGEVEIVTYRVNRDSIFVINGKTGITELSIKSQSRFDGGMGPAIGDIDSDGFGEIVVVGRDRKIYCYEHNGDLKFVSPDTVGHASGARWSICNLADVNSDGQAEIIIGNQIFSGVDGQTLISVSSIFSKGIHPARDNWQIDAFPSPIIIDALPNSFCQNCEGLELVAGNQVFSIDLENGNMNLENSIDSQYSDGYTSIADFDLDGDLDAIVQGRFNEWNTVYIWDIQSSQIIRSFPLFTNSVSGASRINVADLDSDGLPELSFSSPTYFYALDNDFSVLWTKETSDPSGVTVSSVFDFCGDGFYDVLYRDNTFLYIYNGINGEIKYQIECPSSTHIENPIVMDVDQDGQAEIIISCGPSPTIGRVVVFESAGEPWINARPVWNQHAYFNTNINDDLSIPIQQQNPNLIGDSVILNTFLNQYSNPLFPVPDAQISTQLIECNGDSIVYQIDICNLGDNILPALTEISFYEDNPTIENTFRIDSFSIPLFLFPEDCYDFEIVLANNIQSTLFMVVNDNASALTPFDLVNNLSQSLIRECDYLNNMAAINIGAANNTLVIDTFVCENQVLDFNGLTLEPGSSTLFTYNSLAGCDSNIVVNVSEINLITLSESINICAGDSVFIFDSFQSIPGVYLLEDIPLSNCDTQHQIVLSFHEPIDYNSEILNTCTDQNNGSVNLSFNNFEPSSILWNNSVIGAANNGLSTGTYSVTLTDEHNCSIQDSFVLTYNTLLPYDVQVIQPDCITNEFGQVVFENLSPNYSVSLSNNNFQNQNYFENLGPGNYQVSILDQNNCIYENEIEFEIFPTQEPEFQLPSDVTIQLGESVVLDPSYFFIVNDSYNFTWQPTTFLDCDTCSRVVSYPLESINYLLQIQDANSCVFVDQISITVENQRDIFIPNAFSPNSDGINDVFQIFSGNDVKKVLEFKIFDRWGELLFSDLDFLPNNPEHGWNGYFKGKKMAPGVFTYFATIEFIDGAQILFKGDVTLFE